MQCQKIAAIHFFGTKIRHGRNLIATETHCCAKTFRVVPSFGHSNALLAHVVHVPYITLVHDVRQWSVEKRCITHSTYKQCVNQVHCTCVCVQRQYSHQFTVHMYCALYVQNRKVSAPTVYSVSELTG